MKEGIIYDGTEPEQILIGEYRGIKIVVLGVKPSEEFAESCWMAAKGIVDTGVFDSAPAMIIDIPNASVRYGYITEMDET